MHALKILAISFAIALFATMPGSAQQPPTYGTSMTLEQARKVMAAAEAEATKNNWNVAIAIVDAAGRLQLFSRMDNSSYSAIKIAVGKAETAFNFRQPTKNFNDRINAGTATHLLTVTGATFIEGGIPIVVGGKIVGAIGVSGVTAAQDAQVAKAGVDTVQ